MKTDKKFPLTIAVVKDPEDKGYTVFFREYESVVVAGDTEEEAIDRLFSILREMFKEEAYEKLIGGKIKAKIKSLNE